MALRSNQNPQSPNGYNGENGAQPNYNGPDYSQGDATQPYPGQSDFTQSNDSQPDYTQGDPFADPFADPFEDPYADPAMGFMTAGGAPQGNEQFADPQPGYQQAGYQQSGYPQGSYQQGGYQPTGYQQAPYQQAGYQQTGYQQPGYQPQYAPTQAFPAGYANQQGAGYGQPGYGGPADSNTPYEEPAPPPQKKRPTGLIIAIILLVVGVAVLIVALVMWFNVQAAYDANIAEYHELAEANVVEDTETGRPIVDFAALQAENSEIVGWIQIPNTPVNYPVVLHDDNDYYLNHSFLGRYDEFGAVFMDYRSRADLSDWTTVIYGHHLQNGEMFAKIADYADQAEFDTLTNIYYVTDDGEVHILAPLCTIVVSGYDVDVLQFNFDSQTDFESYLQSLISRSSAHSSTISTYGLSHVYILSTCSYNTDNERTMLVCVDLNAANGPIVDATQSMNEIQAAADEAAGITP